MNPTSAALYERPSWNVVLAEALSSDPAGWSPEESQERLKRQWDLILDPEFAAEKANLRRELQRLQVQILSEDEEKFTIEIPKGPMPVEDIDFNGIVLTLTRPSTYLTMALGPYLPEEESNLTALHDQSSICLALKKEEKDEGNRWRLVKDNDYIASTKLSPSQLRRYITGMGLTIVEETSDYYVVEVPNNAAPSVHCVNILKQRKETEKPRKLTSAEIDEIIAALPKVKGADESVAASALASMVRRLRGDLADYDITPLGFVDLKESIVRKFITSRISPGTTVGVSAAEALGGPITQMALNSFHTSGSAKSVSVGVEAMRELLNVSKVRKFEDTTLYFKNPNLSFDEVMDKRKDFVAIYIDNQSPTGNKLLVSWDIYDMANFQLEWWHDAYLLITGKNIREILGKELSEVDVVLRVKLDVPKMYEYGITMDKVVTAIEQYNSTKATVLVIPGPQHTGILDIFPIERTIQEPLTEAVYPKANRPPKRNQGIYSPELATKTFLNQIVVPDLNNIFIQGIQGIRSLFPKDAPVWSAIKDERRVYSNAELTNNPQREVLARKWRLFLNRYRMHETGITKEKILTLLETAGITIEDPGDMVITVLMPNEQNPSVYVSKLIADDLTEKKAIEKVERERDPLYTRPVTPIERAGTFFAAETDGSNFKTILGHPLVDATRTICNNVHSIYQTLGIEAARTFLIREIYNVITGGDGDINPRHIILLVDFMTNLGEPTSITFTGIARHPIETIEKTTIEKALDNFRNAAMIGKVEPLRGTAASVFVGQRAPIGTGYFSVEPDKQAIAKLKAELEEEMRRTGRIKPAEPAEVMGGLDESVQPIAVTGRFGAEDDQENIYDDILENYDQNRVTQIPIATDLKAVTIPTVPDILPEPIRETRAPLNPVIAGLLKRAAAAGAVKKP